MILGISYAIKKGHKKYQAHQRAKQDAAKGTLPSIDDPSGELSATREIEPTRTNSSKSSRSTTSSTSTLGAEKALENDPEFQKYMERHRSLYLQQQQQQQQQRGLPPSYDAVMTDSLTTTPTTSLSSPQQSISSAFPNGEHCACHNCVARQNRSPMSATATGPCTGMAHEMPAATSMPAELDVPQIRINNGSHILSGSSSQHAQDDLILCEMPGDLPAILPEPKSRPRSVSELSANPV